MKNPKTLSIVGSTGSIGMNTLKVAAHLEGQFQVVALAAHSNLNKILPQIDQFHPKTVALYDAKAAAELRKLRPGLEVLEGLEGVCAVAAHPDASLTVSAMTGTLGLLPTIRAIEAGKNVGLANKEALVSGGSLVMELAKKHGVKILPIDSEHSALFQCLEGESSAAVRRLILTSSGGPFRQMSLEQLQKVSLEDALKHPTWTMGPKVTIDSSTLMNKGLEVIEAHWLFDMPIERIEVVVHPQSIIHSMVEYVDGSMIAQMSEPTMIVPIQYALTYPDRKKGLLPPFDFTKNSQLTFFQPDYDKFKCLKIAFDAIRSGDSYPCYMNAANEVLVQRFINKEIQWVDIGGLLEKLMGQHAAEKIVNVEHVLEIDALARKEALTECHR
jgi:1-deoxy-D-xylulose-5-phosphate reductoisomerase